jgi:hypothetical protein
MFTNEHAMKRGFISRHFQSSCFHDRIKGLVSEAFRQSSDLRNHVILVARSVDPQPEIYPTKSLGEFNFVRDIRLPPRCQ